uniref:site-specific DNA-methyltransferase (adenine-specific) n=1 Tax=Candidatus Kentrum sp. LPFa TaxID=2126335 RepID=A0A450XEZ4_9GAMM|nr:MAG: Methyltransferase domain-containing protein [Candidatus Kentron sp. LPFa]VFK27867.1 MAG: Methyltransferase domain-containing protein [Candidatus Kentron sp. LPFa]
MPGEENREHWLEKGDWLALAKQVGARSIFFVGDEPVVVLAELPENMDDRRFFNRIWSMARPQFLFLARPGQLEAYQLTKPPVRPTGQLAGENRRLKFATAIAEVQEEFREFRRDRLETGAIYGDPGFGQGADRADRALVRDLREVRRQLIESGLDPEYAHSLIARALFVRYLEDREIITKDYFDDVAGTNIEWQALLEKKIDGEGVFEEPELAKRLFFRVLRDWEFTYALFERLALDFNGDTLSVTQQEREKVGKDHLKLLRKLLMGAPVGEQGRLFLFAYRFDIVPIELISSIYEEFYTTKQGKGNTQGSHYTPPALAEYLLSQVLTKEVLDKRPRVLDPACGSGIFLVESFRRMARHAVRGKSESGGKDGRLSREELRAILAQQIAGIELNPEAVAITAFSLYLAYLHYQKPRAIDANRRLPNLRWKHDRERHDSTQHLDILYAGNAFEAIQNGDAHVAERFGPGCADVVVGNPPWGEVKESDKIGKAAWSIAVKWCDPKKGRPIGRREQSQGFVHLALELLREGGVAGMLLSSGVLFKQAKNSQKFRGSWLARCRLRQVINFAHVRDLYFSDEGRANKGIAPFILATFEKGAPEEEHRFAYWSAKHTDIVGKTRAVILATSDMHWLFQDDVHRRDWLWKLYWWGSSRDENLVRTIQRFYPLDEIGKEREGAKVISSEGYKAGNNLEAGWLSEYRSLPFRYPLQRYDKIPDKEFVDVPDKVQTRRRKEIFEGQRLLFRRGVPSSGKLVARLEAFSFCFRHSIHGFRFYGLPEDDQKVILGIFWSSLARYYFWLTAGSWGMWHDEIYLHMIRAFPIALPPENSELQARIVGIVDKLRNIDRDESDFQLIQEDARTENVKSKKTPPHVTDLEQDLDEAIFDLYVCGEADRDLVREMCNIGIDFFYNKGKSCAVKPMILPDLDKRRGIAADLPRATE